jgi:hypothetical protein
MPTSTKKTDGGRIPGPVEITNCIEVVWFWILPNTRIAHTITHARSTGTFVPSPTTAEAIRAAIAASYTAHLAAFQNALSGFQKVSVRDMTARTNPAFESTGATVGGTDPGNALPPQTALVLSGKTAERGKGFNARLYIPGWSAAADAGSGTAVSTLTAAMNSFGTEVLQAYSGQGLTMCVAHPHRQTYTGITGTVHPDRPAAMVNLTTLTMKDLVFDTVRARVKP